MIAFLIASIKNVYMRYLYGEKENIEIRKKHRCNHYWEPESEIN